MERRERNAKEAHYMSLQTERRRTEHVTLIASMSTRAAEISSRLDTEAAAAAVEAATEAAADAAAADAAEEVARAVA